MIQKDLLWSAWNIWLSYYVAEGEKKEGDYNDTLRKSLFLKSIADLAHTMSESPYKSLNNFFVVESPEGGCNICPMYFCHNLAIKSMENNAKLMPLIFSEMVLSLRGRIPIIRRELG